MVEQRRFNNTDLLSAEQTKQFIISCTTAQWRSLTASQRDQVLLFVKIQKLVEDPKVLTLRMLLEDKAPGVLEVRKIDEIAGIIRQRLIEKSAPIASTLPPPGEIPPVIVPDLTVPEPPKIKRLLSAEEISSRFQRLGIDIREVLWNCGNFYIGARFNQERSKIHTLPMPSITDDAMKAIENGFYEGTVNRVMIDDARLGEGTTLEILQPDTSSVKVREYNSTGHIENKGYTFHKPAVRLIAYSTTNLQYWNVYDPPDLPYYNFMSLGTLTRLLYYLQDIHHEELLDFHESLCRFSDTEPEVVLNTITRDNRFLVGQLNDPCEFELLNTRIGPKIEQRRKNQNRSILVIQSDL